MSWKGLVLAGLVLGVALGSTAAAGWDPGDVAAAETYRATERERAERYRARVARESAPVAPSVPDRTPDPPAWWERALGAVLAEFDREAVLGAVAEVRDWWSWWHDEARPRLLDWKDDFERVARADGA